MYDGARKEYVWTYELPRQALELVACVDREVPGVGIQVCTFDCTYFCKENKTMEHFRQTTGLPHLISHYLDVQEPIAKIIFGSDREEDILATARVLDAHPLADSFAFTRSAHSLYEILPKGSHKGIALTKLAEHLNLDRRKTVAIGDYDNDVGMFRAAGVGIAVSNASERALRAADLVTVSNEEHAIARIISDIEQGKICFESGGSDDE